jgi:dihydrofolate synthase/folylpolyglutamate synthase
MTPWTKAQAERHLQTLELFGMRFGLDRMRRMMTALGSPQRRFDAIHVLGTNGKTSTTRMIAAILERHGLRTGAYLSPHLMSYCERVQIGELDLSEVAFAAAVARAARAEERVNRTLAEDDHVTQFELLTAAALSEMAEQEVEVAVVEAGLGGRYDATSVIDSCVTVLTNVGLEHTRWLGPTVRDIAEEKLAVLRPGTTLVVGAEPAAEALAVAERVAAERGARIVLADMSSVDVPSADDDLPMTPDTAASSGAATPLLARGPFQRRNFALARLAAGAYLESAGIQLREQAVAEAAASIETPGRLQVVDDDPLTVLDSAHNPDAVTALVEALPEILADRPLMLVLGVLEDKDAARMLVQLLPLCECAWFTAPPSSRALSPAALQSLARQLAFDAVVCEPQPWRALTAARQRARERRGAVLATGSVYLIGDLLGRLAGSDTLLRAQAPSRGAGR